MGTNMGKLAEDYTLYKENASGLLKFPMTTADDQHPHFAHSIRRNQEFTQNGWNAHLP